MRFLINSFFILSLVACNNSPRDRIVNDFDSVSNRVSEMEMPFAHEERGLVDSVLTKFKRTDKYNIICEMLRVTTEDPERGTNILEIKQSFTRYCGDSTGEAIPSVNEDKSELTNNFFNVQGESKTLYKLLQSIKAALATNTHSDTLLKRINKIGHPDGDSESFESFRKNYFMNTPPVAVITILNSFENEIKETRHLLLVDYMKNGIK